MARSEHSHRHYQKHAIVAALALVIAASTFSYALPAASASSASIKAMPKVSSHDKGTSVYLQLRFVSDTANPIQKIRVVVDDTPNPRILEFTPSGTIISGDPSVFLKVIGKTVFVDKDGYGGGYGNGKVIGNFLVRVAKHPLSIGVHNTSMEVVLQGAPSLTANTSFTLTDPPVKSVDIVAKFLIANGNIGKNKEVHAVAVLTSEGNSSTGQFKTTLYLSTDSTLDSGDKAIGTESVGNMPAGSFRIVELGGHLPANTHGSFYLIAMADSSNVVTESNESNNVVSTPISVS